MSAPTGEVPLPEAPSGRSFNRNSKSTGTGTQVGELKDLVVGYAKQETVDPLRTLGRYLGFGLAGSVFIGTGLTLLLLALLRGLQGFDSFQHTFTWAPYFITGLAGLLLVVLFMWRLISTGRQGSR